MVFVFGLLASHLLLKAQDNLRLGSTMLIIQALGIDFKLR